jgi:hypothetical protein
MVTMKMSEMLKAVSEFEYGKAYGLYEFHEFVDDLSVVEREKLAMMAQFIADSIYKRMKMQ